MLHKKQGKPPLKPSLKMPPSKVSSIKPQTLQQPKATAKEKRVMTDSTETTAVEAPQDPWQKERAPWQPPQQGLEGRQEAQPGVPGQNYGQDTVTQSSSSEAGPYPMDADAEAEVQKALNLRVARDAKVPPGPPPPIPAGLSPNQIVGWASAQGTVGGGAAALAAAEQQGEAEKDQQTPALNQPGLTSKPAHAEQQ